MDGESEAGSLENGSNMEDEQNSQTAVTDEFFAELISKANAVTVFIYYFFFLSLTFYFVSHASFSYFRFGVVVALIYMAALLWLLCQ